MIWKQTSCSPTSRFRRTYVRLQRSIDRLYVEGHLPEPASAQFLRWLHGEFYRDAPESMFWIENGDHGFRMEPGAFRFQPEHDASVERHIPPRSERVDELMRYFEQRYRLAGMGKVTQIIAIAASHHRPTTSSLSRRQPKSLKLTGIGKFLIFPRGNFLKPSFYDLSCADLERVVSENDFNGSVARILFNWYYKKKETTPCQGGISKRSLAFFEQNYDFSLPEIDKVYESKDRTVKFLFKLKDHHKVETVLIPFNNKYSICLSSQVGCAMNCSFCFTGEQGLKRNLATSEIVGQFLQAWRWLATNRPGEERILNIVFMGQGEPLHNFDAVKKACEIFLSQYGFSIGVQKITISTAGYVPGLKRWSEEIPRVNLALSLHSPFEEKRNQLIPINKKYPLDEVLTYIDKIPLNKKQFITYEYLLIKDFNDDPDDAVKLGMLLADRCAYINLIPFNAFPGSRYTSPDLDKVEKFKEVLDTFKIPTLIRGTKGDDVLAACGQLNSSS